ncbi:TVP38/TMEM64 family membrane protein [Quillaja saponaria]|uniref:TVP38/TMEM64 family membrane protein n=1 Tax=Quillaja saponaria TaxID=32244 RepID=A0AAD7KUE8_QUISA|nr:TVP38/TMEM64 family membrane protein [Quillaja saponaria]
MHGRCTTPTGFHPYRAPYSKLNMRTILTLRPPSPCLSSSSLSITYNFHFSPSNFLFSFRPNKRFHFLSPCSSLKKTKKQQSLQKNATTPNSAPQGGLRWLFSPKGNEEGGGGGAGDKAGENQGGLEEDNRTAIKGTFLAGLFLVGIVGGFATVGYVYKDQVNSFLNQLSTFIEGYGPSGYALFVMVYAGLEILAIPAVPLTMSAGLLFGSVIGTIIVSISGTMAASIAFLIARYFARERVLKLVEGNKKFLAIDKAIGENGFRVVTLLRLSPLLPFSLGNYLYGLTSVKFVPYVLGSWLGMLPGTWAYVGAGAFGRAIIQEESEVGLPGGNFELLTLALGLLATALAAAYVTRLAKDAMKDIE